MKYTCKFCKTEYNLTPDQNGCLQCVICGHTSMVCSKKKSKNSLLMFIAAFCALLSAIVFTVVIITNHKINDIKNNPLVASVSEITKTVDKDGNYHLIVSGNVINRSDNIYGLPDLIITSLDADGNIISKQKFMPTATLLESKSTSKFKHILSGPTENVKKITASLKQSKE